MNAIVTATKLEFESTKAKLLRAFDATPEDRLNWSPSDSSRTPIELVAHCASSIRWLHSSFAGEQMPKIPTEEFDKIHFAGDKEYKSRKQVIDYLETQSSTFLGWLVAIDSDLLNSMWESPFGSIPMEVSITFPGKHMEGHISQLEYVQTIYGDRVWH